MEYYLAIRRNIIVPFSEMQMNLEIVIQSEVSQKEINKKKPNLLTSGKPIAAVATMGFQDQFHHG